jgi:hypothetical protein
MRRCMCVYGENTRTLFLPSDHRSESTDREGDIPWDRRSSAGSVERESQRDTGRDALKSVLVKCGLGTGYMGNEHGWL